MSEGCGLMLSQDRKVENVCSRTIGDAAGLFCGSSTHVLNSKADTKGSRPAFWTGTTTTTSAKEIALFGHFTNPELPQSSSQPHEMADDRATIINIVNGKQKVVYFGLGEGPSEFGIQLSEYLQSLSDAQCSQMSSRLTRAVWVHPGAKLPKHLFKRYAAFGLFDSGN